MEEGVGSALPSEVMARFSSCCKVRINTLSALVPGRACPRTPGMSNADKIRPMNKVLKDSMVLKSIPEASGNASVTLAYEDTRNHPGSPTSPTSGSDQRDYA